eukprot:1981575-Pyramimonas_sp.AAC.1
MWSSCQSGSFLADFAGGGPSARRTGLLWAPSQRRFNSASVTAMAVSEGKAPMARYSRKFCH